MSLKKRTWGVGSGDAPSVSQAVYNEEEWLKKYPLLLEFLTRSLWGEGDFRKPGSIILFAEDGQFKVCLNDKDADGIAFVSKTTIKGVLEAAEKGLREDTLDWRLTAAGRQRKRK